MNIKDFVKNYYLHDSGVQGIKYIKEQNILELDINFCYWLQDNYQEGTKETGDVKFVFSEVHIFKVNYFDIEEGDFDDDCILECRMEDDGTLLLQMMKDVSGQYYEIHIGANNVEFIEDN